MIESHTPSEQFKFNENDRIITDSFVFFRDNRFAKKTLNNRHGMPMSPHYWAGYGYLIFNRQNNQQVGAVWFLNQVTTKTSYIRISRYMALNGGYFVAVLDELNDLFNSRGYSLTLKTQIEYAQGILNKNYVGRLSKANKGKRSVNDRAKNSSSVDGITYDLSEKSETFEKWHNQHDTTVEA